MKRQDRRLKKLEQSYNANNEPLIIEVTSGVQDSVERVFYKYETWIEFLNMATGETIVKEHTTHKPPIPCDSDD